MQEKKSHMEGKKTNKKKIIATALSLSILGAAGVSVGTYFLINYITHKPNKKFDLSNLSTNDFSIDFTFYSATPEDITNYDVDGINTDVYLEMQLSDTLSKLTNQHITPADYHINNFATPDKDYTEEQSIVLVVTANNKSIFLSGAVEIEARCKASDVQRFDIGLCENHIATSNIIIKNANEDIYNYPSDLILTNIQKSSSYNKLIQDAIKKVSNKQVTSNDYVINLKKQLPSTLNCSAFVRVELVIEAVENNVSAIYGQFDNNVQFKVADGEYRMDIDQLSANLFPISLPTYNVTCLSATDAQNVWDNIHREAVNLLNREYDEFYQRALHNANLDSSIDEDTDYEFTNKDSILSFLKNSNAMNGLSISLTVTASEGSKNLCDTWYTSVKIDVLQKKLNLADSDNREAIEAAWNKTPHNTFTLSVGDVTNVTQDKLDDLNKDTTYNEFIIKQLQQMVSTAVQPTDYTITNSISPGDYSAHTSSGTPLTFTFTITAVSDSLTLQGACSLSQNLAVVFADNRVEIGTGADDNEDLTDAFTIYVPMAVNNIPADAITKYMDSSTDVQKGVLNWIKTKCSGADIKKGIDFTLTYQSQADHQSTTPLAPVFVTVTSTASSKFIKNIKTLKLTSVTFKLDNDTNKCFVASYTFPTKGGNDNDNKIYDKFEFHRHPNKVKLTLWMNSITIRFAYWTKTISQAVFDNNDDSVQTLDYFVHSNLIMNPTNLPNDDVRNILITVHDWHHIFDGPDTDLIENCEKEFYHQPNNQYYIYSAHTYGNHASQTICDVVKTIDLLKSFKIHKSDDNYFTLVQKYSIKFSVWNNTKAHDGETTSDDDKRIEKEGDRFINVCNAGDANTSYAFYGD